MDHINRATSGSAVTHIGKLEGAHTSVSLLHLSAVSKQLTVKKNRFSMLNSTITLRSGTSRVEFPCVKWRGARRVPVIYQAVDI